VSPSGRTGRFWLWLSLGYSAALVLEAVVVRLFRINDGRIGSYLGIPILVIALIALLSGIAVSTGWPRAVAAASWGMVVGGTAEILGLYGGWPFGRYEYTDWWLPYVVLPNGKLYPLLLPVTWFLTVAICYLTLARRLRGWALVIGTAVLAALVDLALEPVITRVVLLWRWLEPTPLLGAPYLNAIGWLLTASLAAAGMQWLGIWRAHRLADFGWMFVAGLCAITVVGAAYGEYRGALALALLPLGLWTRRTA
jgi:uncharacterized membrane protein